MQWAADIRAKFFSKANGKGEKIFIKTLFFYVQKTTFQGTGSIVMDVLLLSNVVRFCNTK